MTDLLYFDIGVEEVEFVADISKATMTVCARSESDSMVH